MYLHNSSQDTFITLQISDLIEPTGPYNELDFVKKQTDETADSPSKSPSCYGNQQMYQNLPDSPESLVCY